MKIYIYAAIGLVFLMLVATIIGQYRIIKQEDTKQVAILNPAERKAEVVERVITRTITKEGATKVVTKEVIRKVSEKTPSIPNNRSKISRFYVSGTYGVSFEGDYQRSYGLGVGYGFNGDCSVGVRYDTIGREQRIALEVRVNF